MPPDRAERRPPGRKGGAQDGAANNVNASVQRDLDIARVLAAAAGARFFCAYPDPEGKTDSGRATGYRLPTDWENTSGAYIDAWKPGMALCMVTGHGLDAIDEDPRNGGDLASLNGVMPTVYAQAATPSGGTHSLIASLGVRKAKKNGIDVQAGDKDGEGRGFVFVAPTVRKSKVTGEPVAYRWTRPPDPVQLRGLAGDKSGAKLAELVRSWSRTRAAGGAGFTQPSTWWGDNRGPIPMGERHDKLVSYAGKLRDIGLPLAEAEILMLRRLEDCAQPPAAAYPVTREEALGKLHDVYNRYEAGDPAAGTTASSAPAGPDGRLEFLPIAELCAQVDKAGPRKFLIRGIWPAGDYGVHAAEMKAQKTWNTADLAVSVASGTPWLGAIEIDQPGPVIMLAGEGGHASIVRRLRAVCAARGLHLEDLPITVCARAPNLGNLAHLAQVQEAVTGASPRLVTLDPLYLSAGNASAGQLYEMGALLGRIQRLCEDAAAALFVVTHFNRKPGAGAQRITGAGPAEWGRVLITATIMSSHTDPATKATTKLARLDMIGGEIPDQSFRVHRVIRADDPGDMNSALHYETTVLDGGEDGGEDGMPPGKANLLAALRADPATPRTLPQLVDWIVNVRHGLPLKRTTGSEYLNELAKDGYADCIDQGPGKAKLWYIPQRVSDDASASSPAGGLTPAADPSSASSPYRDDDGSAGELTPAGDLFAAGWPEGSYGEAANQ